MFKGGTSLSKVFKVIGRFSEDIDLSIGLPLLGHDESFSRRRRLGEPDPPPPGASRGAVRRVRAAYFRLTLENALHGILGARPGGGDWLDYQLEAATKSPVLRFRQRSRSTCTEGMSNRMRVPAIRQAL